MAAAEDADRRQAVLLTVCGKTTYALIKDLVAPNKPKDKTFDELIEIVSRHYKPKPGKIVSRYKFSTNGRKEGQSVSEFVADLRRLAEHCEFGATLDEMLRDVFVIGINKETILRKLLVVPDLDLTKAVSIATTCMTTDEALRVIGGRE